jgi:hypothetical protein
MKSRHVAALALVGWYLMMPPLMTPCPSKHPPKHPPPLNFWGDAPLSHWDTVRSFNRAGDCEKELKATIQRTTDPKFTIAVPANMSPDEVSRSRMNMIARDISAQCVSTDDPRLKGK